MKSLKIIVKSTTETDQNRALPEYEVTENFKEVEKIDCIVHATPSRPMPNTALYNTPIGNFELRESTKGSHTLIVFGAFAVDR